MISRFVYLGSFSMMLVLMAKKVVFVSICLLLVGFLQAREVRPEDAVADSVVVAVRLGSESKLKDLSPGYKDLRAVYDSSDLDMMNYQIGIRQKEIEFACRMDMKRLRKYAKSEKIRLSDFQVLEIHQDIQKYERGTRYSRAWILGQVGRGQYKLHFVLIELNGAWFYGEGLRMERLETPIEVTPDYEAIDRELERKKAAREKKIEDLEKEKQKEAERIRKEEEKARKEKEQEEERIKKEAEKKQKEEEKLMKEKEKEEERKKKEQLKEAERIRKEEEQRLKEKERKEKELLKEAEKEKREAEQKQKEKERKEKEQQKKKERKEQERLKEEERKRKEKEKKKLKSNEKKKPKNGRRKRKSLRFGGIKKKNAPSIRKERSSLASI